jgi:hypothetical protein
MVDARRIRIVIISQGNLPKAGFCPKVEICYAKYLLFALAVSILLLFSACGGRGAGSFDSNRAYEHVRVQVAFGPRPVGSEALKRTAAYIEQELANNGWTYSAQDFEYRNTPIHNILAQKGPDIPGRPTILLGAHYDTRPLADRDSDPSKRGQPILGANDGASGVAVLLEFARVYDPAQSRINVVLAFFDAEDKGGIDGWPFSVGADAVAEQWATRLDAMILVDMIGDADQQIYFEQASDPGIRRELWAVAAKLGYQAHFISQVDRAIADDHVPFLQRGVPAVDIIDFNYPYWHTMADTADKVSPQSLERVGRVLLEYVYTK